MVHRFIDAIRNIQPASPFEVYFSRLQREGQAGGPRLEEAKRDFQRIVRPSDLVM